MKELDIKDYQLVTGGRAFFTRTILNSARTGAVLGGAGYVTEQALLGEPITAKGIIGYSAAGAVGDIATAANAARGWICIRVCWCCSWQLIDRIRQFYK